MGIGEEAEKKKLELCKYCGMRILNLEFHFGVHDRCGEMELRRRWRWYKQWELGGRGKILKRVNYLRRQSAHLPRKRFRYKMKLLADKSGEFGGVKKKELTRSSLEEVNLARKVAGLAPLEEGRGLRREVGLQPLAEVGESPRETLKEGPFKPDSSMMLEVAEKIEGGGLHGASSNKWSLANPSYTVPSLDMVVSDETNNNTVVEGKRMLEEVNDLGQFDAASKDAAAVAWELINNIIEETVGGDLCDGAIGGP